MDTPAAPFRIQPQADGHLPYRSKSCGTLVQWKKDGLDTKADVIIQRGLARPLRPSLKQATKFPPKNRREFWIAPDLESPK